MNNRLIIFLFLFTANILLVIFSCAAQDPQFSQFYSSQLYLNPAFTGNTIQDRVIMNYRKQWPGIPEAFISYAFSYDHKFASNNSAAGIQVIRDKAGSGGLNFTNIAGLYSYALKLSEKHYIRGGIRVSNTWRALDYGKLTFADQLIRGGGVETNELINNQRSYFDAATGLVFNSKNYWVGIAANHLNRPNQSLIGIKSRIEINTSIHGGINIPITWNGIKREIPSSVTIAANYKAQRSWDQLDVGTYFRRDPVIIGVWYRGLPGLKSNNSGDLNHDAVIILLGYHLTEYRLRIGYSYDITISAIRSDSGGSHELSLIYEYASPSWRKNRNFIIPCSSF